MRAILQNLLAGMLLLSLLACAPRAAPQAESRGESPAESGGESETHPSSPTEPESGPAPVSPTEPAGATVPGDSSQRAAPGGDDPGPPAQPVRLVFIHHSTGGNWLADPSGNELGGDLGRALMENNYYASATNYGWGPGSIGDNTDIGHWWDWFLGPEREAYLGALYAENGQNFGDFGAWPRLRTNPGGENQVILFKSCYPNSHLGEGGSPAAGDNPMRGQSAGDDSLYTVANAKALYVDLLAYFAARQDKLFVVVTAPPLAEWETDATHAANARAFNDWLVNDWLEGYPAANVAVFDYFNVLTGEGNHHRWWDGAVQHVQAEDNDFSAYPSGDSHPARAGNQKATAEFVPLLNVFYHRLWAP